MGSINGNVQHDRRRGGKRDIAKLERAHIEYFEERAGYRVLVFYKYSLGIKYRMAILVVCFTI